MAVAGAAALALTACSGDGDGGTGLGADAAPADVVAVGLGDRFENGAAFTLSMEGDLDAVAARVGEPVPPEVEQLMHEGLISGAFHPEDGLAVTVGAGGGFLEMRTVDQALYLRLDLEQLSASFPEAGDIPPPEVLRGQLDAFPLPPDVSAVAEAALNGEWVGITGLSQETLQRFADTMGQPVPSDDEVSEQEDAVREILEDEGLLDGQAFTERYLAVEGDGPTYGLTVMTRDLFTTLNEISSRVESSLGAAGAAGREDLPDPDEIPETISGFSVSVEGGTATAVGADVATVAESTGDPIAELEEGDLVVTMLLDDIGDQLSVPDATTVEFEQLLTGVMGGMMGGGLAG